jgi:hypothetical protein
MYNRDEVRAQNERQKAQWPHSILWATAAIVGAPVLAYNLWTLLDPLIHFKADSIGLTVPLILGSVALWKAMRPTPTWAKLVAVPIYFVAMGVFLFVLAFSWAGGHGRGCL